MQFGGSNSHGFAREAKEKLEGLLWGVRERESYSSRTWEENGRDDHWGSRKEIDIPLLSIGNF